MLMGAIAAPLVAKATPVARVKRGLPALSLEEFQLRYIQPAIEAQMKAFDLAACSAYGALFASNARPRKIGEPLTIRKPEPTHGMA